MTENGQMNTCEEYREAVGADPSFDGGASHVTNCASCQEFRREMQALDQQLGRALALTVPDLKLPELPEIDTSNVAALPRRRFGTPAWLAVAATVTIAAFVGFRALDDGLPADSTLADQIVAHMSHEPYALRVTNEAVSDTRLARVVPASIATMDHDAGLITYAQSCKINGRDVPHLVIQGARGPVTILLMPEEMVNGNSEFSDDTIDGVILKVGDGSIAIIGEKGESLENIEKRVKNSVTWDI
jgi:hypothetical protein